MLRYLLVFIMLISLLAGCETTDELIADEHADLVVKYEQKQFQAVQPNEYRLTTSMDYQKSDVDRLIVHVMVDQPMRKMNNVGISVLLEEEAHQWLKTGTLLC